MMPRSPDLLIYRQTNRQTDRTNCFTPCACMQGNKANQLPREGAKTPLAPWIKLCTIICNYCTSSKLCCTSKSCHPWKMLMHVSVNSSQYTPSSKSSHMVKGWPVLYMYMYIYALFGASQSEPRMQEKHIANSPVPIYVCVYVCNNTLSTSS